MTSGAPAEIAVRHLDGDRFSIEIRGHVIHVDQPAYAGGTDTAPTPTELFIASLSSCIGFYGRRYLARHDIPADGLEVHASYVMSDRPARVGAIEVRITPPAALPDDRRASFLAVSSHCTVHNSLGRAPDVSVGLGAPHATAAQ